jgi:conjugative transfer region protein TrbK
MIVRTLSIALALIAMAPTGRAQDTPDEALVQKLLGDPKALREALAHCDPKSTAIDRECRAADEARRRQFFGTGTVPYSPQKVDPFPTNPTVVPPPRKP